MEAPATTGAGSSRFWKEVARVSNKLLKMASVNAQNNKSHIIEVRCRTSSTALFFQFSSQNSVWALRLFKLEIPFILIPSYLNYPFYHVQFTYMGLSLLGSFLILRWALNRLDPNKAAKEKVRPFMDTGRCWYLPVQLPLRSVKTMVFNF